MGLAEEGEGALLKTFRANFLRLQLRKNGNHQKKTRIRKKKGVCCSFQLDVGGEGEVFGGSHVEGGG